MAVYLDFDDPPAIEAARQQGAVWMACPCDARDRRSEVEVTETREHMRAASPQEPFEDFFGAVNRLELLTFDQQRRDTHMCTSYQRTSATSASVSASVASRSRSP